MGDVRLAVLAVSHSLGPSRWLGVLFRKPAKVRFPYCAAAKSISPRKPNAMVSTPNVNAATKVSFPWFHEPWRNRTDFAPLPPVFCANPLQTTGAPSPIAGCKQMWRSPLGRLSLRVGHSTDPEPVPVFWRNPHFSCSDFKKRIAPCFRGSPQLFFAWSIYKRNLGGAGGGGGDQSCDPQLAEQTFHRCSFVFGPCFCCLVFFFFPTCGKRTCPHGFVHII